MSISSTHFDSSKKDYWNYTKNFKDAKWIERHAFYPFIHYQEEKRKFDGKKIVEKPPRDIRYSFLKRCIQIFA